jgi:hypothetical protein
MENKIAWELHDNGKLKSIRSFKDGILDTITVYPKVGENRNGEQIQVGHKLKVKFKLPIIDDKLEYINESKKSEGYRVINGKKVKDIGTVGINVGGRGKKTMRKSMVKTVTPKSSQLRWSKI